MPDSDADADFEYRDFTPEEHRSIENLTNFLRGGMKHYISCNPVEISVAWFSLLNIMVDLDVWACDDHEILSPSEMLIETIREAAGSLEEKRREGMN